MATRKPPHRDKILGAMSGTSKATHTVTRPDSPTPSATEQLDITDDHEEVGEEEEEKEPAPETPRVKHFKCQVSLSVPKPRLRNRMMQTVHFRRTPRAVQVKPPTRTVATQCNLLRHQVVDDNTDCATQDSIESDDNMDASSSHQDPDYIPEDTKDTPDLVDGEDDVETANSVLRGNPLPSEEKYFLVAESCLQSLLSTCIRCGKNQDVILHKCIGTMVVLKTACPCDQGSPSYWHSQKMTGTMPLGNILLATSTLASGSCVTQTIRLFNHTHIPIFSVQTYHKIQSCYLVPSVHDMWTSYQQLLMDNIKGRNIVLGGDGRCDSPGYSAKYGSYTLMDLDQKVILDMQLVQSNEVKSSCHMELEGLKRGIGMLDDNGCQVSELVTDRHSQVQKYMREEQSHIKHMYDVWHVAKSVQKKLEAVAKKKDCKIIGGWIKSISNHMYWVAAGGGGADLMEQKWKSVLNHVCNIHEGHGSLFSRCAHGDLDQDKDWIEKGSRAYKALKEVIEAPYLLKAIRKLSPIYQTYSLEVFHSLVNKFAPKSTHFFYPVMKARMLIAVLHFNENGNNKQKVTKNGELRWRICYPRAKKGTQCVVKPVNSDATYEYVDCLRETVLDRRCRFPSYNKAKADYNQLKDGDPGFLTEKFCRHEKQDLVNTLKSRFPEGQ